MPNSQDPAPVSDGCGLLPYVPAASAASIAVWRLSASVEGSKVAVALPLRLDPDADEVALAEVAGGGVFRVQARDHAGRFLRGYPAREIYIEGPPREVSAETTDAPEIETPPAPLSPEAPRALASQAVPVADPIAGMPSAMLDVPGMDPILRAWLARFDALGAYQRDAMEKATKAAREYADAERNAAQAHTQVAVQFVEKVTSPQVLHQGEALRALEKQLETIRAELAAEREKHAQTRAQAESARVEAATFRALLQAGGRYDVPTKGAAEILVPAIVRELGPVARGAIASALGIPAETLALLTSPSDASPDGTKNPG